MTYLSAMILTIPIVLLIGFLVVQLIDKYAPYDSFDEEQAKRDVEELLKHANKPPRKRAF